VQAVAIDETATRKGHRYATVVVEIDPHKERPARLLFMTPERSAASVGQFVEAMPAHGARPGQVKMAAIDMSAAYQKGVREYLPDARMVFDRFHVMQLAGNSVDEVRRQLAREGADVKGSLWALRGNESRLTQVPQRGRVPKKVSSDRRDCPGSL
jgi:transposase